LGTWSTVFAGGRVWIDGPDGYYHLRRAWLTLRNWPWTPQTDMLIGVPEGGPISWPPFFDWILATLALPWGGQSLGALETWGAWLPPVLGLLEIGLLYWVVGRAFGPRAAGFSAFFAAVLPGVSRYSLLGALDHDPLVESIGLLAVGGLMCAHCRGRVARTDVVAVAAGTTLLVLTWAGSILHLGLLYVLTVVAERVPRDSEDSRGAVSMALGWGSLIAAQVTLPFVLSSVWTETMGATFIGLSWLHTAALLGGALLGLGLSWWRQRAGGSPGATWTAMGAGIALAGLLWLTPIVWPAFRDGFVFFGRGESFLQAVAESRPLLSLFGNLDLRPMIVRLSLLALLLPVLLPWMLARTRGDRRVWFLGTWLGYTLLLALVQSRYAHAAAFPVAALMGVLASNTLGLVHVARARTLALTTVFVVLLSSLPAYVSIPGFAPYHFYGRIPLLARTGMGEVCDFFRDREPPSEAWADPTEVSSSSVLAPWSAGHWLMWSGHQGTVMTPLGPQAQPAFADGIRFYLSRDPQEAMDLLEKHRVRHVVTRAEISPLGSYLSLAGVERSEFFGEDPKTATSALRADVYLSTIAARLTWFGTEEREILGKSVPALDGFEEVFRTARTRPTPFPGLTPEAEIPLARVYRVTRREDSN